MNFANADSLITLITAPEIVGTINIAENNVLRIYPPWDVISADKLVLNILYFSVITDNKLNSIDDDSTKTERVVVQEFDCPCLRAKKCVNSCIVKFSDDKPSIVQYMFGK